MSSTKKKNSKKKVFFVLFLLIVIGLSVFFLKDLKIQNIYINGNNILSDNDILKIAELEEYPNFFTTFSFTIEKKLKSEPLIKDATVTKKFLGTVDIKIEEHKILLEYDNRMYLDDYNSISKIDVQAPLLSSELEKDVFNKLIDELSHIDNSIFRNLSEISYSPTQYDNSRFVIKMRDGNTVYINIVKFENLNYYNEIYPTLNGKKGVLYLDSGNHFEKY